MKKNKLRVIKQTRPKREKIFVAVPTISNTLTVQLAAFLDACRMAENEPNGMYSFHLEYCNGYVPVHYARNWLVGKFLQSDYSRLWFFDDDMLPNESAADILNVDADICAGKMFRFDHQDKPNGRLPGISLCAGINVHDGKGYHRPITPQPGEPMIQEVDVVGSASMVIRRNVLEDPRMMLSGKYVDLDGTERDYFTEKDELGWAPPIFRCWYKPSGQMFKGEDIDFCDRAKALGYSIKVHLGAVVGHHKTVDLDQVVTATHIALERYREFNNLPFENFYRRELKRCSVK